MAGQRWPGGGVSSGALTLCLNHKHCLSGLSKVKAMAPVIDIQGKTGCDGKDGEDQGG